MRLGRLAGQPTSWNTVQLSRSVPVTAMLEDHSSEQRVSTGLDPLDTVLGGLYWGDNVVWQLDSGSVDPFYSAIARRSQDFDTRIFISLGGSPAALEAPTLTVIRAGSGNGLELAGD